MQLPMKYERSKHNQTRKNMKVNKFTTFRYVLQSQSLSKISSSNHPLLSATSAQLSKTHMSVL